MIYRNTSLLFCIVVAKMRYHMVWNWRILTVTCQFDTMTLWQITLFLANDTSSWLLIHSVACIGTQSFDLGSTLYNTKYKSPQMMGFFMFWTRCSCWFLITLTVWEACSERLAWRFPNPTFHDIMHMFETHFLFDHSRKKVCISWRYGIFFFISTTHHHYLMHKH